jgi:hypothetical protein
VPGGLLREHGTLAIPEKFEYLKRLLLHPTIKEPPVAIPTALF